MKKNLLFVIPSLEAGGGEKSLVNLLSQINYQEYNVDVFMFNKAGMFLKHLPKQVRLLDHSKDYEIFKENLSLSLLGFIKANKINLAYSRFSFSFQNRTTRNSARAEQYSWKYISQALGKLDKEYDVAIGYLEKSSIYFVIDNVNAKKKFGWIHTSYSKSQMDKKFDSPYFNRLDHLITVSEKCMDDLNQNFKGLSSKVKVINNIVSPTNIYDLASEEIVKENDLSDRINVLTIGRLSYEKGIDLAIEACKILKSKGYKVNWIVIGGGGETEKLNKLINKKNLANEFKLLGYKENPYPYIASTDIYVQPSRYEGKSIAIDEAKILHKPIVVTNYKSVEDQIKNNKNGIIVELDEMSIAKGIEKLICNQKLKSEIIYNLKNEKVGTEVEINKLYNLF